MINPTQRRIWNLTWAEPKALVEAAWRLLDNQIQSQIASYCIHDRIKMRLCREMDAQVRVPMFEGVTSIWADFRRRRRP
jgi:hypothetical protein